MHRLSALPILAALLALPMIAFAQEVTSTATPDPTNGWPVVERCVTDVREPDADWTFEGTIITFRPGDGVHAFRADVPTRYYLAYDNYVEAGSGATISPDGRWLAVMRGDTDFTEYGIVVRFFAKQLRIVSTINGEQLTVINRFSSTLGNLRSFFEVNDYPIWLSTNQVTIGRYGEQTVVDGTQQPLVEYTAVYNVDIQQQTRVPVVQYENFEPNFVARYSDRPPVVFGTSEPLGYWQIEPSSPAYSPSYRFILQDDSMRQNLDTCIEVSDTYMLASAAASPDGTQIALPIGGEDGFVYIFDIEEWALYRLNLAANNVVAWLPEPT